MSKVLVPGTKKAAAVTEVSDNGVWRTPEERSAGVLEWNKKRESAGIKSWNIVPQDVHDPLLKSGLGMVCNFDDFIPYRMKGKCSDGVLEKTLNVYNDMKADGAKVYEIRAAIGPMFMEHEKELEAARTDQVPRIRRFNFVVEDLHWLYVGPLKTLKEGNSSFIQGSRLEAVWSYWNGVKRTPAAHELHGHMTDQPLMEHVDALIMGKLHKDEVWAHTGEPVLAMTHPSWAGQFVLEAEDSAGNTCSVPVAYPLNSIGLATWQTLYTEETQTKLAAAKTTTEKHAIAMEESKTYAYMLKQVEDVLLKVGDNRPNPTSNFVCRIVGFVNGEGTPSQQVGKYQADQATIDKFSAWQNEVGIHPESNCTLTDFFVKDSKRRPAKFNTQTIVGKMNFGRAVNSLAGAGILLALL